MPPRSLDAAGLERFVKKAARELTADDYIYSLKRLMDPKVRSPYAFLVAIDLNKGDILWQIAHGETADNVRNNPALSGLPARRLAAGRARVGLASASAW